MFYSNLGGGVSVRLEKPVSFSKYPVCGAKFIFSSKGLVHFGRVIIFPCLLTASVNILT